MSGSGAERAEISPPELIASPQRNGHLPLGLRNPILATRLTLAILIGSGAAAGVDHMTSPIVAAQTICNGQLTVLGIKFADHPNLGRNRIVDPTDFYLGNGDFKVVEIYDATGKIKFDAWDGKDSAKKPKPIASGNMSDKGTHSIARIAFSGDCDENRGSAKRVWLTFPLGTDKAIYPEVVDNNRLRVHIAGRNERRITELQGVANNGNFPIEKVGGVIAKITKELGTPVSFTDTEQLKGDAKTISEANRISLRAQIAKLVKEQEESRREEEKKAQKILPTAPADDATKDRLNRLEQDQKAISGTIGSLTTKVEVQAVNVQAEINKVKSDLVRVTTNANLAVKEAGIASAEIITLTERSKSVSETNDRNFLFAAGEGALSILTMLGLGFLAFVLRRKQVI